MSTFRFGMTVRRSLPFFVIFCFIFVFTFLVSTAQAADFTVNSTVDTVDEDPSSGGCLNEGTCTLRSAIAAANFFPSDDTITLPTSSYILTRAGEEDYGLFGDLDILNNGTLTIIGDGAGLTIIDGDGDAGVVERLFQVQEDATLTLKQLSLQNVHISTGGDCLGVGINNNNGTVKLDGVTIANNSCTDSSVYGLSIFSWGKELDILNSTIENNSATGITNISVNGGVLYAYNDNATTIQNSVIANNSIELAQGNMYGAAVYIDGPLQLISSSINDNAFSVASGSIYGAALFIYDSAGINTSNIDNSTIDNNTAVATDGMYGIGIYADNAAKITNTTISRNVANNLLVSSSGGGIYNAGYTVTLLQTTVANNSAETGSQLVNDYSGVTQVYRSIITSINGTPDNCSGTITSREYNLDSGTSCGFTLNTDINSTDPLFVTAEPADNGGSTKTFALSITSPAINHIVPSECEDESGNPLTLDQRAMQRRGYCDIGAYEYQDNTAPTITMAGDNPFMVQCASSFTDPGATVLDDVDGDLTGNMTTTQNVNTAVVGNYSVNYSAQDLSENVSFASRSVVVSDSVVPTVTVVGSLVVELTQGTAYTDEGATAADTCDSSVTLTTDNPVNTAVAGTYIIQYTAIDDSGNSTLGTRTVIVDAIEDQPQTNDDGTEEGQDTEEEQDSEQEQTTEEETVRLIDALSADTEGTIFVTYTDGTNERIVPFDGASNFVYTMNTLHDRVIVTNGRVVKIFSNGAQVTKKRIAKSKQKKYMLKVGALYDAYDSIFILLKKGTTVQLVTLRLKENDTLAKKVEKKIHTVAGKLSLKMKTKKHRVIVHIGKNTFQYVLKKNGKLQQKK